MISFKPISISLSPNTEKDDINLALKLIFQPWRWKKGKEISKLEEDFKNYFQVKYAISFNSGRSALSAILESLRLKKGGEVLLQAFTCNAVVNPILWALQDFSSKNSGGQAGLKPVYVDCNEDTFNLDLEDLKRKITHSKNSGRASKNRVLIIQHTFGQPADINEILKICQKNNLILIEDGAHSLGATYKGKTLRQAQGKVGTFGKAAFFSFSRDKVISSVYGGMAITDDDDLAEKIKDFQKKVGFPSDLWIFQQLLHPILMNYLILPTYQFLGKYLLVLFQQLHILSKAVHWKEKRGKKPDYFPKAFPNALSSLANLQFKKLEKFNCHRKRVANFYFENLQGNSFKLPKVRLGRKHIFLRFSIRHPKAHQIIKKAWKENILIGDWYDKVIAPHDTKLDKMKYQLGSCPKAEKLAKETFNLPTHINISQKETQKIIDFLTNFA